MLDQIRRIAVGALRRATSGSKAPAQRGNIVRRPDSVQIKARRFELDYVAAKVPRYWAAQDPFLTHFMNALSLVFPDGEQMFVDSVRAVRGRVQDPETRKDIVGFMAQEALHSQAHVAMNDHLKVHGYPVEALLRQVQKRQEVMRPAHSEKTLLALTCALEHLTALMGNLLLTSPELQKMSDSSILPLWLWHALEETEHKAVAFDVYQELYNDYWTRVSFLVLATIGIFSGSAQLQRALLRHDGLANDPRVWLRGMRKLWGSEGYLSRLAPQWLEYFRRDFHPWQHDNSAIIARYRSQFEQYALKSGPNTTAALN